MKCDQSCRRPAFRRSLLMWFKRFIDSRAPHLNVTAMRKYLFVAVIYGFALIVAAEAQDGPKRSFAPSLAALLLCGFLTVLLARVPD